MASPSSGRYRRLFNFVHQQSRRLTENLRSASRHLQVSAAGAQLPFTRFTCCFSQSDQLGNSLSNRATKLAPLQADDTISQPQTPQPLTRPFRVLLLVNVPSEEAVSTQQGKTDSPNRNRPVVRGIATQLSSHTLVLVTAQNEILDVLTPNSSKITRAIIGEEGLLALPAAGSFGLGQAYPTLRETGSP